MKKFVFHTQISQHGQNLSIVLILSTNREFITGSPEHEFSLHCFQDALADSVIQTKLE